MSSPEVPGQREAGKGFKVAVSAMIRKMPILANTLVTEDRPRGRLVIVDFSGNPERRTHGAAKHGPHGEFGLDSLYEPLSQAGFHHLDRGALDWPDLVFLKRIR